MHKTPELLMIFIQNSLNFSLNCQIVWATLKVLQLIKNCHGNVINKIRMHFKDI